MKITGFDKLISLVAEHIGELQKKYRAVLREAEDLQEENSVLADKASKWERRYRAFERGLWAENNALKRAIDLAGAKCYTCKYWNNPDTNCGYHSCRGWTLHKRFYDIRNSNPINKKVVINSCYGGFGLSPIAISKIAELKGIDIYFYEELFNNDHCQRLTIDKVKNGTRYRAYTKDFGERVTYKELSHDYYFDHRGVKRDDPDLVKVVEELGDKAGSWAASLKIVEVPDDVEWEVMECDGAEWLVDEHRVWS